MKEWIRKKIKGYLGLSNIEMQSQYQVRIQKDITALHFIDEFIPQYYFPVTNMALNPRTIHHILNEIVINSKTNIVELGAGFSTIIIANFLKSNFIDAKFHSIDHDADWISIMSSELAKNGLSDRVNLIHAPLSENTERIWYSASSLKNGIQGKIDLLIVDGPPRHIDDLIREGVFLYARDLFDQSITIIFDDTHRSGEKFIVEKWSSQLGLSVTHYDVYSVLKSAAKLSTDPIY